MVDALGMSFCPGMTVWHIPPGESGPDLGARLERVQIREPECECKRRKPKEQAVEERGKCPVLPAWRGEENGVIVELDDVGEEEDELDCDRRSNKVLWAREVLLISDRSAGDFRHTYRLYQAYRLFYAELAVVTKLDDLMLRASELDRQLIGDKVLRRGKRD